MLGVGRSLSSAVNRESQLLRMSDLDVQELLTDTRRNDEVRNNIHIQGVPHISKYIGISETVRDAALVK